MQPSSVQKSGAVISTVGGSVRGVLRAVAPTEREAKAARHRALTLTSLVWGVVFLAAGLALLAVAPIGGTVTTAFGLLGWGGFLNLLAIGP
ncbi:MAG: hypothetical protein L0Y64_23880 [Myxococcaceae bacterium]|nr:hypothetical protein [Myxococcaceae bacterium]